jgi:exodeoxyribonuclease VII large subunit
MELKERKIHTLTELAASLRSVIEKNYTSSYWVKTEVAKLNHYPRSGHAYPELVEKKEKNIVAQFRGTIWASDFNIINNNFLKITGEPLKDGMEILCRISVGFHAVYGLSLTILEVEPSFTLGQMAVEKAKTIEQLKKEEIFDNNKKLTFPLLPRKIAVISVETSKGYSDYREILNNFEGKYKLFNILFPAILQGEQAIKTILQQLRKIRKTHNLFDAVIIIRGGGGDIGLNCYNNYEMAKEIATFPVPIITGIGHSTNETVAEMVSHVNKITPTDVAYFLLGQFEHFSQRTDKTRQKITNLTEKMLSYESQLIAHLIKSITHNHNRNITIQETKLENIKTILKNNYNSLYKSNKEKVSRLENHINLLDPANILKRGYSLSIINGEIIKSNKNLTPGQIVTTKLFEGSFESIITKTE